MVFKNNTHKKIGDKWLDILENDREHLNKVAHPIRKTLEEIALSIVLHRENIKLKEFTNNKEIMQKYHKGYSKMDVGKEVVIIHGNYLVDRLDMRKEIDELASSL